MSFKAPEPERMVVRDVITFLEDRRALYVGAVWEQPEHVVSLVLKMREELTTGLKRIGDNSPAKDAFRLMRAACRDFLTRHTSLSRPPSDPGRSDVFRRWGDFEQEEFLIDLGKLRATFGQQVALLGYLYGVDIEEQLAETLPPAPGTGDIDK